MQNSQREHKTKTIQAWSNVFISESFQIAKECVHAQVTLLFSNVFITTLLYLYKENNNCESFFFCFYIKKIKYSDIIQLERVWRLIAFKISCPKVTSQFEHIFIWKWQTNLICGYIIVCCHTTQYPPRIAQIISNSHCGKKTCLFVVKVFNLNAFKLIKQLFLQQGLGTRKQYKNQNCLPAVDQPFHWF